MTIKNFLTCYNKNNDANIELVVWNEQGCHEECYLGFPHPNNYTRIGSTLRGTLKLTDNKLQSTDTAYLDICKELKGGDIYILNRNDFHKFNKIYGSNDFDINNEPEKTFIIAVEKNALERLEA